MKKIIFALLPFFSLVAHSQNAGLIAVEATGPSLFSNTAKLSIKNNDSFPNIVLVKLFNANENDLIAEITTTVESKKTQIIDVQPNENLKFKPILSWRYFNVVGDLRNPIKDNNFRIPFLSNYNVTVCQSSDGPQTTHIDDRVNAIDFCTNEKTPIVAAKDGTVIKVIQNFTESGLNPALINKANKIEILHEDGLISSYLHIFTNSSTVSVGDKVKRGQQIALVGSVGYSSGPHLHFEVSEGLTKLNQKNELLNVIPVKFYNIDNVEIKIKSGLTYDVNGIVSKGNNSNSSSKLIENNAEKACGAESLRDDKAKAIDCYSKNQYEDAITYFNKHVIKFPNDSLSLARLAIAYTRLSKHNEAVSAYKKAVEKNWISYDFASLYARSLYAIGEKEEAIKWNKRALTLAPNCNDCRRDLAIQLKDMGRKAEAFELLNSYDEKQKELGKPQYFQGLLMLFKE
jgi:murein DD-endopeptidase MepM/ murein hydrolase activator NlpD